MVHCERHCEVLSSGWQAGWLMTTGCGAALQLDASSSLAHQRCWQPGQRERERDRETEGERKRERALQNKTLTSAPWLPPLCLTSGHNSKPPASSSDRSVKATQMAWTHPSSGPVIQTLLYFCAWLSNTPVSAPLSFTLVNRETAALPLTTITVILKSSRLVGRPCRSCFLPHLHEWYVCLVRWSCFCLISKTWSLQFVKEWITTEDEGCCSSSEVGIHPFKPKSQS